VSAGEREREHHTARRETVVRIALLYPTVLGLYGDRGNALVLAHRAARRGIAAEIIDVAPGTTAPDQADVYLVGGGEDIAQTTACELLAADGALARAVARRAPILAVCAGYQILGNEFAAGGRQVPGLGLLDIVTRPRPVRAVGELVAEPIESHLPMLTGYENHGGATTLGPGLTALARVRAGHGNGVGDGTEGVRHGRIIGTYCHGPALARNPALADLLLGWIVGEPLSALDDATIDALRAERLAATSPARR
jgi:lipid II isoglutaminyl synthase (glutamine-hydrolysing)